MPLAVKIAHLSSVHSADDVRIVRKEASSLARAGYAVEFYVPCDQDMEVDGVMIRAVPRPRSRTRRVLVTAPCVWWRGIRGGARVLHFHDPELLPWGILAALAGRTVVYDVHEDVPSDIMDKDWIAPRLRLPVSRAAALLERAASAFLSAIVAATPAIARRFPSAKTVLVQNFPFLDEFAPMDGEPSVARDGFVYVGGITEIRGAREMVRAMSEIRRESSPRLALAGVIDPPELLPELERLPGFDRCEFLGWRDRKSVAALMRRAIAGLVLFHPVQNHIEAQPNKLFEYMSAGLPVVASDFPVWRSIVVDGGCGICVDPLDPKAIAQALDYLRTHPEEAREMGRRGRRLVLDRYNWREEQGKLLGLYSRLC